VAWLFAGLGVETGVDVDALLALRETIGRDWLPGEALHGHMWRAGLPKTLRAEAA
jgi:hydroxymethylglutaryl-CoA lyase